MRVHVVQQKQWMAWNLSSASPPSTPVPREASAPEHLIFQAVVNNRRVSAMLRSLISSKFLNKMGFFCASYSSDSFFSLSQENEHAIVLLHGRQQKVLIWINDKFGCKCMWKENCQMLSEDFHFAQVFTPWPSPWHLIAIHFAVYIAALALHWRVALADLFILYSYKNNNFYVSCFPLLWFLHFDVYPAKQYQNLFDMYGYNFCEGSVI